MTGHKIVVDNPVGVEKSLVKTAKRAIKAVLSDRGVALPCRVELVFADKEDIRALNLEKRGIDAVTDVLSFPMLDLQPGRDIGAAAGENDFFRGRLDLGSIVICAARAYEQAKEYGHSQAREFAFLAAHSALHLLGYDHGEDGAEMFVLQERILAGMGLMRSGE